MGIENSEIFSRKFLSNLRRSAVSILFFGVVTLVAVPVQRARASGVPVLDIAAIEEAIRQFIIEGERWSVTTAQYSEELTHFKSTLSKYQSIINGFNIIQLQGIGGQMQEVDEQTYLVKERCRTSTQGMVQSLIGMLPSLNLDGDGGLDMNKIREQQLNICRAMQQTRNKKYNASLRFIRDTLPQMQGLMDRLKDRRNGSSDSGAQTDDNTDATMVASTLDQAMNSYNANMQGYDAYLESLQATQVTLADIALKGRGNSALGSMVRTGAMMEALDVSANDIIPGN